MSRPYTFWLPCRPGGLQPFIPSPVSTQSRRTRQRTALSLPKEAKHPPKVTLLGAGAAGRQAIL